MHRSVSLTSQITSIKKNISDIEGEIKELEGSNPDKKAEFVNCNSC